MQYQTREEAEHALAIAKSYGDMVVWPRWLKRKFEHYGLDTTGLLFDRPVPLTTDKETPQ